MTVLGTPKVQRAICPVGVPRGTAEVWCCPAQGPRGGRGAPEEVHVLQDSGLGPKEPRTTHLAVSVWHGEKTKRPEARAVSTSVHC